MSLPLSRHFAHYAALRPLDTLCNDPKLKNNISQTFNKTPQAVIEELVQKLQTGQPRLAPAASEALRIIGNRDVLEALIEAAQKGGQAHNWVLATLGRLSPAQVVEHLTETPLLQQIAPMLLISQGANWLSTETAVTDISFLLKQTL